MKLKGGGLCAGRSGLVTRAIQRENSASRRAKLFELCSCFFSAGRSLSLHDDSLVWISWTRLAFRAHISHRSILSLVVLPILDTW